MCRSLADHCPEAVIFVLALDDFCYDFLATRAGQHFLRPVRLDDLEAADGQLLACRGNRSRAEYIFTTTPCLPRYLLEHQPEIDQITYLDADLYFYSSPEPIFAELAGHSVAIIPHRFAANVQYMAETRGIYNVGWITYTNNHEGRKCLDWYRERCLEWCYDRVEDGRFADQKYLERFSEVTSGVVSIKNRGANLAAWNLAESRVELEDGTVMCGGDALVFFHFQGLKRAVGTYYDCGLFAFRLRLSPAIKAAIFSRYIRAVKALKDEYALELPDFTYGFRYRRAFPWLARSGELLFSLVKIALGFGVSA